MILQLERLNNVIHNITLYYFKPVDFDTFKTYVDNVRYM